MTEPMKPTDWPEKVLAVTRHWGKTDTAGRFMGCKNIDVHHPDDAPKGFIAVEYIRADLVADQIRAAQLEAIKATLKHVLPQYTTMWKRDMAAINTETILKGMKP